MQSTNDFVIPGPLHMNEDGQYTGPISRWACRIECERLPPYRAFIYAGGFDDQQVHDIIICKFLLVLYLIFAHYPEIIGGFKN